MSSNTEGQVVGVRLCVGHREPMRSVTTAKMVKDYGLEGDRHAGGEGPRKARQALLMDRETLEEFGLPDGEVRENLTISGLDFSTLLEGQRLSVGEVELEVTGDCAPCARIDEIRPGLKAELQGRRGILVMVLRTGTVSVGDGVRVLETAAS
ncbi:MAG: MOSC domain-containing protein [Chloroflexi bacterium]|nr:MOSC domain-containing protein [Chloroflexota bacterium]